MFKMTIGRSLGHGFAGNVAQHPDIIIGTEIVEGGTPVYFGDPVMLTANGKVAAIDGTFTGDNFVGIASSEIRSAITVDSLDGVYRENDRASICKRGVVSVACQSGNPVKGGKVYVRISNPPAGGKVGGFEAVASGADTVELPNCVWFTDIDAEGITAIRMKTINLV